MNKLLYISYVDIENDENTGVVNKIKSHITFFQENGFEVVSLNLGKTSIYKLTTKSIIKSSIKKLNKRYQFSRFLLDYLEENKPSIMYIRYQFSDPFLAYFLKKARLNKCKVIMEIPTYPYKNELSLQGLIGRLKYIYDSFFRFFVFKSTDRIVTYSTHSYIYGIETIKTFNGVDFKNIPLREFSKTDKIRIIAVSSMKPWHGYDRLIKGMIDYYQTNPTVIVNLILVGYGSEFDKYIQLANNPLIKNHIEFTGSKSGDDLNDLFDQCDIAISTLGLHRIKLLTASTLKSREYAARGLPFVTASKEEIGVSSDFILNVTSNDSNIDVHTIIDFYNKLYLDPKFIHSTIRTQVMDSCSIQSALKPILLYIMEDKNND